jgi:hypothetical protein|eukprot:COSAG05_NODE_14443_length_396_cov_1.208754_1_plen_82_part_00
MTYAGDETASDPKGLAPNRLNSAFDDDSDDSDASFTPSELAEMGMDRSDFASDIAAGDMSALASSTRVLTKKEQAQKLAGM